VFWYWRCFLTIHKNGWSSILKSRRASGGGKFSSSVPSGWPSDDACSCLSLTVFWLYFFFFAGKRTSQIKFCTRSSSGMFNAFSYNELKYSLHLFPSFFRFWWESPKERDHWKDQGVGGKMGSEWILLGRLAWGGGLDSTGSGQGPVAGCGECSDEPSGSCATESVSFLLP
jgi:hypothetical protein